MKKVIFAALMLIAGYASADTYVTASVGHSNMAGNTQSIGVGTKVNDWLDAEVDYRNFGGSTDTGAPIAYGTMNPVTHVCTGCRVETSTMQSKMTGLEASGKINLAKWAYARGGLMYHSIKTSEVYGPSLGLAPSNTTTSGVTPVIGFGLTAYGFALEVTSFGNIYPTPDGKRSVSATSISYKLEL